MFFILKRCLPNLHCFIAQNGACLGSNQDFHPHEALPYPLGHRHRMYIFAYLPLKRRVNFFSLCLPNLTIKNELMHAYIPISLYIYMQTTPQNKKTPVDVKSPVKRLPNKPQPQNKKQIVHLRKATHKKAVHPRNPLNYSYVRRRVILGQG